MWGQGQSAVGVWLSLPSGITAEMVGQAGFDYACIDTQHGVVDYQVSVTMLQAIDLGPSTPLVRVPWNEPGVIAKMLDAGAQGVIVPMVNSPEEAEAAVSACRYPPRGARSYGPLRVSLRNPGYGPAIDDEIAVIPMIETVAALSALDEILAIDGIDAIYVGPADLSISLGLAPKNNDGEAVFDDALARIVERCKEAGVVAGIHSVPELVERRLEQGFTMVTATGDSNVLRAGLSDVATRLMDGGTGARGMY